jgi:hypothetical protein
VERTHSVLAIDDTLHRLASAAERAAYRQDFGCSASDGAALHLKLRKDIEHSDRLMRKRELLEVPHWELLEVPHCYLI